MRRGWAAGDLRVEGRGVDRRRDRVERHWSQTVAPPAAAPRVPLDQPSQSARPGSLKWTWASTAPGRTCRPRASISSSAGSVQLGRDRLDPAVGDRDVGARRGRRRGARRCRRGSAGRSRQALTKRSSDVERDRDVGRLDRLGRVVADAALAAHEQHRHRRDVRPSSTPSWPAPLGRRTTAAADGGLESGGAAPWPRSGRPRSRRAAPSASVDAAGVRDAARLGAQRPRRRRGARRRRRGARRASRVAAARDHVARARLDLAAARRWRRGRRPARASDGQHELGGGGQRVAARRPSARCRRGRPRP